MENSVDSPRIGFFGRLKRLFKNDLSLTDPKAWTPALWNLEGYQTKAGVNVNEETALTYSAVFNAISLISGTISILPLRLLIEKNRKQVVLDMAGVKVINSMGLGAPVAALTSLRRRGGDMRLARLSEKVEGTLAITHLVNVFRIYEDLNRAVASFKSD